MSKNYKQGDTVSWTWGNSQAEGTVESVKADTVEITTKGSQVKRKGTKDNPAITIKQDDGTKVLKLADELS